MARTPLLQSLKEALSLVAAGGEPKTDTGKALASRTTRREFVKRAGIAGAGALAIGSGLAPVAAAARSVKKDDSRVVIVGAGLAGLTAAYRLKQAGLRATVIEGSPRIGGRCFTIRDVFAPQITERGGELIDTGHKAIRKLAHKLELELDDVRRAEPLGTHVLYYFDGQPYSIDDAATDFQEVYPSLRADSKAAGYPTLYTGYTAAGKELDEMSVRDWINSRVPGGLGSKLGQLLDVAYAIEYGADTTDQSSLNLIYLLSGSLRTELEIFGASDERFKVRGGTDTLTDRLGEELGYGGAGSQIITGARLTAVSRNIDDTYTLVGPGVPTGLTADHVVMAIPFSILRGVDFSGAGFSPVKKKAINELGMGSNAKLQLQFEHRSWYDLDCTGDTYADLGYQTTWEATRAQDGDKGIIVNYRGGTAATALNGANATAKAEEFLDQFEHVLPGITEQWNDKAMLTVSVRNPWALGSYSYFKVGQYTAFAGAEGERSGNCHFAGEHTSIDYQGYLNGAVDTGIIAAKEILTDLRLPTAD